MKPFLLILQIVVVTPEGGIANTVDRFYVPSKAMCEDVQKIMKSAFTWQRHERNDQGLIQKTRAYSIAKIQCIPMRGVQHMPGDE
jgi:hypothetical protein